MKLSAVVVTYNEEKNIDRCLKSLSFADEIIIVDSRSTDKTIQIAKKYADKIIYRDFDNFSAVKNAGIDAAKGPWILSVDADEEITPGLRKKITDAINNPAASGGYLIKRLTLFLGKIIRHSGWGNRDYQLRLFKKNEGKFEGRIHESVRIKGEPARIKEHMLHYSYPDTGTYISKMNRYTSLQAQEKKPWAIVRMIFNPFITFFSMYFLKAGFLDGWQGFVLAVFSGFSEFIRFAKTAELISPHPKPHPKPQPKSNAAIEGEVEDEVEDEVEGLIIRMPNWVGDCVIATAFLPALKKKYRHLVLVVKKGTEDVFAGNPNAGSVIIYDRAKGTGSAADEMKKTGIKTAVSFSPSFSSHLMLKMSGAKIRAGYSDDFGGILLTHTYKRDKTHKREHVMKEYANVLALLGLSFNTDKLKQELFIDPKQEKLFLKSSELRAPGSAFVLAPYAGFGPSKTWPIEYYEELALAIIKKSKKNHVYITGAAAEGASGIRHGLTQLKQFHDLRGIPLQQAFMLIENARAFIGNDSGLMHAADALGVPVVVIFGSTAPYWGGPVSKKAKTVYKGIECQPCFDKYCRYGHYKCLKEVSVREVLQRVNV